MAALSMWYYLTLPYQSDFDILYARLHLLCAAPRNVTMITHFVPSQRLVAYVRVWTERSSASVSASSCWGVAMCL